MEMPHHPPAQNVAERHRQARGAGLQGLGQLGADALGSQRPGGRAGSPGRSPWQQEDAETRRRREGGRDDARPLSASLQGPPAASACPAPIISSS